MNFGNGLQAVSEMSEKANAKLSPGITDLLVLKYVIHCFIACQKSQLFMKVKPTYSSWIS